MRQSFFIIGPEAAILAISLTSSVALRPFLLTHSPHWPGAEQLDGGDAEDGQEGEKPTNKKDKKVTLRDYERRELLEKGAEKAFGGDSDSDDNDDANAVGDRTYVEEQADLKSAFRDIDVV
jgi:hypothetical protein